MAIFLDSADLQDAEAASRLGFVRGVTTNPKLIAAAGRPRPDVLMQELSRLFNGPVFYQLTASTTQEMLVEAGQFHRIAPNLGIKIMCTLDGLRAAAELSSSMTVAVTGIFHPGQAYLSAQTGAAFVIPYVNRITRFLGDGLRAVEQISQVIQPTGCQILAASIKSPEEALETLLCGAHHISVPLSVIQQMAASEHTDQALDEFRQAPR
jgi:transaldolase